MVDLEEDLRRIAEEQNTNVNELVELVNENEEILASMKSNLKSTFASAMAKVVMRSDSTYHNICSSVSLIIKMRKVFRNDWDLLSKHSYMHTHLLVLVEEAHPTNYFVSAIRI